MGFKIVIFDFDGTLIESNELKKSAFLSILNNYPSLKKEFDSVFDTSLSRADIFLNLVKKSYPELPNNKILSKAKTLTEAYSKHILDLLSILPLRQGVINLLCELKEQGKLIIISSATPKEELIKVLKRKNLIDYFDKIYGHPSNKINTVKKLIEEYNNISLKDFVVVGDGYDDFESAMKNSISFLNVGNPNRLDLDSIKFSDLNRILLK